MAPSPGEDQLERRVVTPSATPSSVAQGASSGPFDPFAQPIGRSGLPGAAALRRSGGRLGIFTVRDLLFAVPRRWITTGGHRSVRQIRGVAHGTVITARLQLVSLHSGPVGPRRLYRTVARLVDEDGDAIEAVWFGRQFIERRIGPPGTWIVVAGKVGVDRRDRVSLQNPDFEPEGSIDHQGGDGLLPVYRLTDGIRARTLRRAIRAAIDAWWPYPDYLGPLVRGERMSIGSAIETIHFPKDQATLDQALDRLAFDELLALQVGMVSRRRIRERDQASTVQVSEVRLAEAVAAVERTIAAQIGARTGIAEPAAISLTNDQLTAVRHVRDDLASGHPMMRLIQGDVGSGKTAVAALAMAFVADAGGQAALLAPTDLLARQHAATLSALLEPLGHEVVLLTGSVGAAERREAIALAATPLTRTLMGRSRGLLFVGTQALVQDHIGFADLRLAVVDEQHRFGVAERDALSAKGGSVHVLLMTATPIPQVLGQVLHADLDVSDLHAAPVGRLRVRTGIRRPAALDRAWDLVRTEAAAGHRTFVVVPLIEAEGSDDDGTETPPGPDDDAAAPTGVGSAEAEAERLGTVLAPLRVGMVHGRLNAADRDAVMTRFRDGDLDVLVGTTVVEVGVDVPQATIMIVESADRFGLAQLHQLRGRVGRGTAQSWCVLVSDAPDDSVAMERLRAVERTTDGFELAELDISLRKEGELLGLRQSGLPPLRVARLADTGHRQLSLVARHHAERLVGADGRLFDGLDLLERELTGGWLARIGAGDVLAADELDG
jgi:ATP-dependent DNA helicase RecG